MFFFNWSYYIDKYVDLQLAGINTEKKAINHWLTHGKKENRIYADISIYFDWKIYLLNNNDLIEDGINTEEDAWRHYIYYGYMEKRYPTIEKLTKIYCLQSG